MSCWVIITPLRGDRYMLLWKIHKYLIWMILKVIWYLISSLVIMTSNLDRAHLFLMMMLLELSKTLREIWIRLWVTIVFLDILSLMRRPKLVLGIGGHESNNLEMKLGFNMRRIWKSIRDYLLFMKRSSNLNNINCNSFLILILLCWTLCPKSKSYHGTNI